MYRRRTVPDPRATPGIPHRQPQSDGLCRHQGSTGGCSRLRDSSEQLASPGARFLPRMRRTKSVQSIIFDVGVSAPTVRSECPETTTCLALRMRVSSSENSLEENNVRRPASHFAVPGSKSGQPICMETGWGIGPRLPSGGSGEEHLQRKRFRQ